MRPLGRISLYHPSLIPLQSIKTMRELLQVQAHLVSSGLFQDLFVASRVLKFCADSGNVDYAVWVCRHVESPDAFCVNSIIKSYAMGSNPQVAIQFYFSSRENGFLPNNFTFPPLAKSCAMANSAGDGGKCHGQALKFGVHDMVHVQNSLIHMYASCGLVDCARALFDGMAVKDVVSWNSIIDGYMKVNDISHARMLFNEMPVKNVVSWNLMIAGCLKGSNPGYGLKLFREMQRLGIHGNITTMVSVVTACGRSKRLKEGQSVHGSFLRNYMGPSLVLETALVDMYSKCQKVNAAKSVFDRMSERNLICWNAMLLGHCIHGCPEDGLALFNDMVEEGSKEVKDGFTTSTVVEQVVPDEVTFIGVLCACLRAGLLLEGKKYLEQMATVYNVIPKFAHYWCMANLYASLGFIQEAIDVLRGIPKGTECSLWSGLLGFCRFQGDVELGESIATRLIELEPYRSFPYVLLWNVYAVSGHWDNVQKVKNMVEERGIKLALGSSLVDLNALVHEFKVGDRSQPEMDKIYLILDELAARLKLPQCATDPS